MPRVKKHVPSWVENVRLYARVLVIVWAAFFLFFLSAHVFSAARGGNTEEVPFLIAAIVIILSSAIVPWKWEGVGSFLLLGEGVFLIVFIVAFYTVGPPAKVLGPISVLPGILFGLLAGGPPLVGGVLSLVCWRVTKRAPHSN